MAEFCPKCAIKRGFPIESPPIFCEDCGIEIPLISIWKRIGNFFKKLFS